MTKHLLYCLTLFAILFPFHVFSQNRFEGEIIQIEQKLERLNLNKPLVFTGSSTIRLWQGLEKRFAEFEAVNSGFGGSKLSDLIHFQDRLLMNQNLRGVVLYSGDNDFTGGQSSNEILASYKVILERLFSVHDVKVFILSVKQSPALAKFKNEIKDLNVKLKTLASEDSRIFFIDFNQKLLLNNGEPNRMYFASDMLHLNKAAYSIIESMLSEQLRHEL